MSDGGSGTTLAAWMEARLADVDAELASRMREAIGPSASTTTLRDAPELLLHAATSRLQPLALDGCVARESAIELLAVDALVTLACEALADACADTTCIVDATTRMVHAIAATLPELDGAA